MDVGRYYVIVHRHAYFVGQRMGAGHECIEKEYDNLFEGMNFLKLLSSLAKKQMEMSNSFG